MYIGGTDERALHHLAAEVLDNAMDEAVAGHANRIEVTLEEGNRLTISDNGRGMPVDEHPKFPGKSALEVIMTTLHSGGKFSGKAYATSGGLHGVGVWVVNALSSDTRVEVARNKEVFAQDFSRGIAQGKLQRRSATRPTAAAPRSASRPTPRSSAIASSSPSGCSSSPARRPISTPGWKSAGNARLARQRGGAERSGVPVPRRPGRPPRRADRAARMRDQRALRRPAGFPRTSQGRVEWAVAWPLWSDGAYSWYCNTVPTPDGGTHEQGLRAALTKGIRAFGELVGQKKAKDITADDVDHRQRNHALGVHPRSAVPEPDQGPPDLARSRAPGRERGARPLRPFPVRQHGARPRAAGQRDGADGRAPAAQGGARDQAQDRDQRQEAAPARQAHRLSAAKARARPSCSSSRATAPAAAPSRRATARPRRSCRSAARSSTSPAPPPTRSAPTAKSPT